MRKNINVIVTGSEGFIGSALCERLKHISNITYSLCNVNVIRIDRQIGIEAIDIEQVINSNLCANKSIDVVFHLAAQTSVFNTDYNQIAYDNMVTFAKVCDVCYKYEVKLVYASSSCANDPRSMYGASKLFDEIYAKQSNTNATGVRLHNVYGRNQREGMLLYNLLNGHTILYNNGNNYRHFTYIDDAINGLLYATSSDAKVLNCVNPEYISVKQFVDKVNKYSKTTDVEYTDIVRLYDNPEQNIDESILTIPMDYTTVDDGLSMIL